MNNMENTFFNEMMKYQHMAEAWKQKKHYIESDFNKVSINYPPYDIFIRIFKNEKVLELWGRDEYGSTFTYIKSYEMTGFSGELGPKRREGDRQIPEGFYHINRFNPDSKYYLSLGIDYPNSLDSICGDSERPGKDIFIHGGSKTVGCIPIGDEGIKELYITAASVLCPFNIMVHIFPSRLDEKSFSMLKEEFEHDNMLIPFWTNLKEGYQLFDRYRVPFDSATSSDGRYVFTDMEVNI